MTSQNQMLIEIKNNINQITQLLSATPSEPQTLSKQDNLKMTLRKSSLLQQLKKNNINNK